MGPLIITHVRHAVPRCCKVDGIGPERLSCDNDWLIGDVCVSSEYWSCEKCDLCPVQDIEVAIERFSAMMWGTMRMRNHSLMALVNSQVHRNRLVRRCAVPRYFSIKMC